MKYPVNQGDTTPIYCCGCQEEVQASLTNGAVIYPHRQDLHDIPFWICQKCGAYVGCHHKTKNRTKPLGSLPTYGLRKQRAVVHQVLDPVWRNGHKKRSAIYRMMSDRLGRKFHTGEIRTDKEAREAIKVAREIRIQLLP